MVTIRTLFIGCFTLFVLCNSFVFARRNDAIDPRTIPIRADELKSAIRITPLKSEKHLLLIVRAQLSGQLEVTRKAYAELVTQQKNKGKSTLPESQMWHGIACARQYAAEVMRKQSGSDTVLRATFINALQDMEEAYKILPTSLTLKAEYGFFLWQYGSSMKKGLAILHAAYKQSPDTPLVLMSLAEVYYNPTGNAYDVVKSEEFAKKAIELDSAYAYPYLHLTKLAIQQKNHAEARRYLDSYIAKCHKAEAVKPYVAFWSDVILSMTSASHSVSPL